MWRYYKWGFSKYDLNVINYRPQTKFAEVMFLHVSVILSTRVCVWSRGGCLVRGVWCWQGLGGLVPEGGVSRSTTKGEIEGDLVQAHTQGGSWRRSGPAPPATAAGGTHPTGMHSCCLNFVLRANIRRNWKLLKCIQIDKEGSIAVRKDNSFLSIPWMCSFSKILQNFSSERQILWRMCFKGFHAVTLKLPVQTSLSEAPKLPVSLRSDEKCEKFSKMSTPHLFSDKNKNP